MSANQSSVRFCPECSNMLHPRQETAVQRRRHEDEDQDQPVTTLMFACRNCEHQEPADQLCVYRHQILHHASEQTQWIADVASDPTLPRTHSVPCPQCQRQQKNNPTSTGPRTAEVVFFQSRARRADTTMTLYYVCCQCGHRWMDPTGAGEALGGMRV